jgi:hypothetical protein
MSKTKKVVIEDVKAPDRYDLSEGELQLIALWADASKHKQVPRSKSLSTNISAKYGCVRTTGPSLFCRDIEVARIENQYGLLKRRSHNALVRSPDLRAVYHAARGALIRSHLIVHTFVVPKLDLHSKTNLKAFLYRIELNEKNLHRLETKEVDVILHNWLAYLSSIKEFAQYVSGYIKLHNPYGSPVGYKVDFTTDAWWIHRMEHFTIRLEEMLKANNLDTLNRLYATAALDEALHRTLTVEEEYLMSWKTWMEAQIKGIRHETDLVPFPV